VIKAVIEEATKDWEETTLYSCGALGMYNDDLGRPTPTTVGQQIAWASGISRRTVQAIMHLSRPTIHFATADKITAGLEVEHFWYDGPLEPYYDPPAKVA